MSDDGFRIDSDELERRRMVALCPSYLIQNPLHRFLPFPFVLGALIVFAYDCTEPLPVGFWLHSPQLWGVGVFFVHCEFVRPNAGSNPSETLRWRYQRNGYELECKQAPEDKRPLARFKSA